MSFDLDVYMPKIPEKLTEAWLRKLRFAGLFCEFHPEFDLKIWEGTFFPISVRVREDKFPSISKQGIGPWVAGFHLEIADFDPIEDPLTWASPEFKELLNHCRHRMLFTSSANRSVLDFTLQCFAAATLASVAEGVLSDPQSDCCFVGRKAIQNAVLEVEEYEKNVSDPNEWHLHPFPGWNLVSDDSAVIDKAAVHQLVNEFGDQQLKNTTTEHGFRYFTGNASDNSNFPAVFAHGGGLTVLGRGYYKVFHPTEIEKAIAEYRALLKKCGYRL